jgi:hypothetical protein
MRVLPAVRTFSFVALMAGAGLTAVGLFGLPALGSTGISNAVTAAPVAFDSVIAANIQTQTDVALRSPARAPERGSPLA